MLKKLTSRKFLVALATVICGIAALFGAEEQTVQIAGAVTALASAVTYITSEGRVDCEALTVNTEAEYGEWGDGQGQL